MVRMEIKQIGQEEWHQIINQFENLSLAQIWEYAEAKARLEPWKVVRHVFWKNNEIVGVAQGVVRTIPFLRKGLVWINRAPLWRKVGDKGNLDLLREMLKELKKYWVNEKDMYLRVAPPILDNEENRLILIKLGFAFCNPSFRWTSARIDLTKAEEELRKELKQKWRNCLNKAERLGVCCEFGTSGELSDELVSDYKKLLRNKKINTPISPEFIRELQNLLPGERKMWIFTCRHNNKRLGSILIACYGHTCEYFVGAIDELGKKYNAGQFSLWRAICEMKKLGYRWFDVGGADPERTPPGILHFKQGLGGRPYRLVGEFEAHGDGFIPLMIKMMIRRHRRAQLLR